MGLRESGVFLLFSHAVSSTGFNDATVVAQWMSRNASQPDTGDVACAAV